MKQKAARKSFLVRLSQLNFTQRISHMFRHVKYLKPHPTKVYEIGRIENCRYIETTGGA